MVAIALIEYGASSEEAIKIIRKSRPGALNMKQTNFLLNYKSKIGNGNAKSCCITF